MRVAAMIVMLACGCSKGSSDRASGSGSGSGSAATKVVAADAAEIVHSADVPSCEDRALALQNTLQSPSSDFTAPGVTLPTAAKWRELGNEGTRITVTTAGDIVVDGKLVPDDKLARYMQSLEANQRTTTYDVIADAEASAKTLANIAAATRAPTRLIVMRDKIDDPLLAAKAPKAAADWYGPWLDQLKKAEMKDRLQILRDGMKRASGTQCAELPAAFAKIASANPAEAETIFAETIPRALDACKCAGVDPAFEAIVVLMRTRSAAYGYLLLGPEVALDAKAKTAADVARSLATSEP